MLDKSIKKYIVFSRLRGQTLKGEWSMKDLIVEETGRKTKLKAGDLVVIFRQDGSVALQRGLSRLLFGKLQDGRDDKMIVCGDNPWQFIRFLSAVLDLGYQEILREKNRVSFQLKKK